MLICNVHQDTFDNGTNPNKGQTGTEWLPIKEKIRCFPKIVAMKKVDHLQQSHLIVE